MSEVRMERMSWVEYRRRVETDDPVVFLPCGSLEQHGPHLPLGVDAMLSTAVACEAARRCGGIVAPALAYGYKSQPRCGGGQHFPGTTSLDGDHLSQLARDVIREFARHGVRKLALVDGHYENQWFLIEGIDLALRDLGRDCGLRVLRTEYWDFCTEDVLGEVFPDGFPGFALEHAAVIETSLMLHFHPDLVWTDRIPDDGPAEFPPYDLYPPETERVPPSGVLSSARGASAGKGALLAEAVCGGLAGAVHTAFVAS
ncbi:creatininase [Acidihalobacter prosperus]|uniref:Creatinine amidohydrolase n=1 Tax=Acidihalobacter prosperus TaxID=160660 RepID=A0A1A6C3V8_9GAMM|nr:creatininase [Acidihalobacter prosperus]OBS09252.1 Creatinine amidohydrolase [Acidihalobacter prosperus]